MRASGGRRCLIVDDQALVGMAIESSIEETGLWRCDLVHSARQALACLDRADYDVAILDYMLQDGPCTEVAAALKSRGIPFVVYSDDPRPCRVPPILQDARWLEKLSEHRNVLRAVAALTATPPIRHAGAGCC